MASSEFYVFLIDIVSFFFFLFSFLFLSNIQCLYSNHVSRGPYVGPLGLLYVLFFILLLHSHQLLFLCPGPPLCNGGPRAFYVYLFRFLMLFATSAPIIPLSNSCARGPNMSRGPWAFILCLQLHCPQHTSVHYTSLAEYNTLRACFLSRAYTSSFLIFLIASSII